MIGSVSGGSASSLITALMKDGVTRQNMEVAVIKKGQDVQKMQGEAALKLINAAANLAEPGKIDVHV
ncbi:hypothetical protein [Methylomonas rapida]|uniref:Motility protein YjfB-like n=1 Tax=Methylomonas rapida TaxID=2963939 RepID=A0ABY7GLP9_9GAMM|nr:hypothetical protein [Methylomonas rapida]WAR45419.1 hypothetical protein NM686_002605 [Methylomonas rapida]